MEHDINDIYLLQRIDKDITPYLSKIKFVMFRMKNDELENLEGNDYLDYVDSKYYDWKYDTMKEENLIEILENNNIGYIFITIDDIRTLNRLINKRIVNNENEFPKCPHIEDFVPRLEPEETKHYEDLNRKFKALLLHRYNPDQLTIFERYTPYTEPSLKIDL